MGCCTSNQVDEIAEPLVRNNDNEKRVVIIGAGPSGIHMASLFAKAGYNHVKILEKEARYGGMSWTVRDQEGHPQEMGTCFGTSRHLMESSGGDDPDATGAYERIYALFAEYTPDTDGFVDLPDTGKKLSTTDNVTDADGLEGFTGWMTDHAAQLAHPTLSKLFDGKIGDLLVGGGAMEIELVRYVKVWEEIFGEEDPDEYELPQPKTPEHWDMIAMPMENFLKENELEGLAPLMLLTYTMFGYGTFNRIPAYYPLWWYRPSFIKAMLNLWSLITKQPTTSITTNGYQTLWLAMLEKHKDRVFPENRCNVTEVHRATGGTKVHYTRTNDDGETSENIIECDILIVACGTDHALTFLDASPDEREVFSQVKRWTLATSCVTFDGSERISKLPADTLFPSPLMKADGRVVELRMTQNAKEQPPSRPGCAIVKQVLIDDNPDNGPLYTPEIFPEGLAAQRDKFLQDSDLENPNVEHKIAWAYFPHFEPDAIKRGMPWRAREMQGNFNTYFVGDCMCFESVKDVVDYNMSVWKKHFA